MPIPFAAVAAAGELNHIHAGGLLVSLSRYRKGTEIAQAAEWTMNKAVMKKRGSCRRAALQP